MTVESPSRAVGNSRKITALFRHGMRECVFACLAAGVVATGVPLIAVHNAHRTHARDADFQHLAAQANTLSLWYARLVQDQWDIRKKAGDWERAYDAYRVDVKRYWQEATAYNEALQRTRFHKKGYAPGGLLPERMKFPAMDPLELPEAYDSVQ